MSNETEALPAEPRVAESFYVPFQRKANPSFEGMHMSSAVPMRKPSVGLAVVRVVLVSALLTLLCFAVALFAGIVGIALANLVRGGGMSLSLAYRHVALPFAVFAFAISLIAMGLTEKRQFKHRRSEYENWRRAA